MNRAARTQALPPPMQLLPFYLPDCRVHAASPASAAIFLRLGAPSSGSSAMSARAGTGARNERGEHDNIVNALLRAGNDGEIFREAMEAVLLPRAKGFRPDLNVISAGFDAHRLDPLGGLDLVEEDFAWATTRLMEIAERHAKGRIVSVLEGGYHLEGLARSAAAHVAAPMGT